MVEVTTNITRAQSGEEQSARRFWLVRHGLTEGNTQQRFCGHSDIPLSSQGRAHAPWLAQRLKEETISAICTTDLGRAREKAETIGQQRTPAVQVTASA